MAYVQEEVMEGTNVWSMVQALSLLLTISVLPFFIHSQFISGPFINALLIVILFLCGIRTAVVAALIPSMMALAGGLLPAVLAPTVPFIMISNVGFILLIDFCYKNTVNNQKGYWLGVAAGAVLKFTFLYISVNFIGQLLTRKEFLEVVVQMMSWTQFATALMGGIIAWAFLKWLKFF
ncbi:MAG: ECF transporter S component [Candidatus Falkowbacteria bacterium]